MYLYLVSQLWQFGLISMPIKQLYLKLQHWPFLFPVQSQYSASQFNEEFDFEAMNEKFKKDEVWGSLGRASKTIEGLEDNASTISLGDRECHGLVPNSNPKVKF